MDNKTLDHNKIAHNIVNAVVPSSFMKTNKCSQQIYKKVKHHIFEDALKLLQKKQHVTDIILTQKQKIQAILHSEILLAEQKSLNNGLNVTRNDTCIKEDIKNIKPLNTRKDSVAVNSYFEHLSQYKKDIELFNRVKGLEMRGKKYKISNDGSCPKCSFKKNVFVILDFLFLSGDMPEILQYLMAKGNAILWSSKGATNCKDPPTFLCSGRCPSDVSKSGFNINWGKTDLEKIYLYSDESKDKLEVVIPQDENDSTSTTSGQDMEDEDYIEKDLNQSEYSDEEYDEGLVDISYYRNKVMWVVLDEIVEERDKLFVDEEAAIRTMLALEEARNDYITGEMKVKSVGAEENNTLMEQEESKNVKNVAAATNLLVDTAIATNSLVDSEIVSCPSSSLTTAGSAARDMLTNAGAAARDILRRENKSKTVPIKTPTHILKLPSLYIAKEVKKPAFTAADFPVSSDGACPYCKSTNVVYIIIQDDDLKEEELPPLLTKLLKEENAKKVKKGEYDLPSFQCKQCTYGFNLDWSMSSLETIFLKKDDKKQIKRKANIYEQQTASYYASYFGYQQPCYIPNQWMGYIPHNNPVNPYAYGSYGPYGSYGYYSQNSNLQETYVGNVSNVSNTISTNATDTKVVGNSIVEKIEVSSNLKEINEEDILTEVKEPSDNKAACENENLSLQINKHKSMSETIQNDSLKLDQMTQLIDAKNSEVNKLGIKNVELDISDLNNGELITSDLINGEFKTNDQNGNQKNRDLENPLNSDRIVSNFEQNGTVSTTNEILKNDCSLTPKSNHGANIYFSNDSIKPEFLTNASSINVIDDCNKCSLENEISIDKMGSSNSDIYLEDFGKSFENDLNKINHSLEVENKSSFNEVGINNVCNDVKNEDKNKIFGTSNDNKKLKKNKSVTKRVTRSSLLSAPKKKKNLDSELSETNDQVCEGNASSLSMMASTDEKLKDLAVDTNNFNSALLSQQVLKNTDSHYDSDILKNADGEFIDSTNEIKVETISNTKSKSVRGRKRGRGRRKSKL
ncbi:uncharacterized protein LOC101239060 isoform X1 [Hydra vulgaris]|uniref:uncharacterized protein LOC101239060 isoform X1 n=1 Tax=Hydra vulgaris TaxID=6087 RepID=UPI001F5E9B29|nr:uncharacterized protein LOC101239060 [Hydra vulgaris]